MTVASQRRRAEGNVIAITGLPPWSQMLDSTQPGLKKCPDANGYVGRESLNGKLYLVRCNITALKVDAVVCAIQTDLHLPPVGMCKDMWSKGGPVLKQSCLEVGTCKAGHTFLTNGYNLLSKYVIHTAGPSPTTPMSYSDRVGCLKQSYLSCLDQVLQQADIQSVAFPCLGSGGAGIQLSHAVQVGLETIRCWLEAGNNANMVEQIVLCMYSEDQRDCYLDHLLQVFPSGKDLAGIDLELLTPVDTGTFMLPTKLSPGNYTPVLCFMYEDGVEKIIQHHFHNMVNFCVEKLSSQNDAVILETRYRDCAILTHTSQCYKLIVYNSPPSCTIELRLLNFSTAARGLDEVVCRTVRGVVRDYLDAHLENLLSPDPVYLRCGDSQWGTTHGLWSVHALQEQRVVEVLCTHAGSLATTHAIRPQCLLEPWDYHLKNSESGRPSRSYLPSGVSNFSDSEHCAAQSRYRSIQENSDDDEDYEAGVEDNEKPIFQLCSTPSSHHTLHGCTDNRESVRQCASDQIHGNRSMQQTYAKDIMYPEYSASASKTEENTEENSRRRKKQYKYTRNKPKPQQSGDLASLPTAWCPNINPQGREATEHADHIPEIEDITMPGTSVTDGSPAVQWDSETGLEYTSATSPKLPEACSNQSNNLSLTPENTQYVSRTPAITPENTPTSILQNLNPRKWLDAISTRVKRQSSDTKPKRSSNMERKGEEAKEPCSNVQSAPSSENEPRTISEPEKYFSSSASYQNKASITKPEVGNNNHRLSLSDAGSIHNDRPEHPSTATKTILTDEVLSRVAQKVGSNHYMLGIRLGVGKNKIDVIIHDHPHDARLQSFLILQTWRNVMGKGATIVKLLDEMRELDIDTQELRERYMDNA